MLAGLTKEQHIGLITLDFDHFKSVNDSYGHAAEDTVLEEVATRLGNATGAHGFVARTGGEEMAVVLTEANDLGTVTAFAERLRGSCRCDQQDGHARRQLTATWR